VGNFFALCGKGTHLLRLFVVMLTENLVGLLFVEGYPVLRIITDAGKHDQPKNSTMKPIYIILLSLLLTGCLKANITPVSSKSNTGTIKVDTLSSNVGTTQVATLNTYDWYNGTKGTALIQVTCNDCNAIATIGNVTIPFIFNEQGVGQLKYTPAPGLVVYIAVCPGGVKAIKAEIFDAVNTSLYTYSGVSNNWNNTYIIK
jgi:hypothetical protein